MQDVQINHLRDMAKAINGAFSRQGFKVKVGGKLPGIHWQFFSKSMPRSAEIAAGLIDYRKIISTYKEIGWDLTFTAIEMHDDPNSDAASGAATLVRLIATEAFRQGVNVLGENALAIHHTNHGPYRKMAEILANLPFRGITVLRIQDVVGPRGEPILTPELRAFVLDSIARFHCANIELVSNGQWDNPNLLTVIQD
jgi:hypothetical protein